LWRKVPDLWQQLNRFEGRFAVVGLSDGLMFCYELFLGFLGILAGRESVFASYLREDKFKAFACPKSLSLSILSINKLRLFIASLL